MWNLRRITLSVGVVAGLCAWALGPARESGVLRSRPASSRAVAEAGGVTTSSLPGSQATRTPSRDGAVGSTKEKPAWPKTRPGLPSPSESDRSGPSAGDRIGAETANAGAPTHPARGTVAAAAIQLDDLVLGEITARVEGFDPDAPRALLAWRRLGDDFVVMARGRSRVDGSLEFRELILPESGLEIVVTGANEAPDAVSASGSGFVAARPLVPPRAQISSDSGDGIALRVTPAESSGVVLLAAEGGEIFARHALPAHPSGPGRVLDLRLALPASDRVVWLAHENPDGRRSAWHAVALEEKP